MTTKLDKYFKVKDYNFKILINIIKIKIEWYNLRRRFCKKSWNRRCNIVLVIKKNYKQKLSKYFLKNIK
jgi:hypothetical protein